MKVLKYYISIACFSFAFVMLINCLLNVHSAISMLNILQIFACTSMIALLMSVTDRIFYRFDSILLVMIVQILDICLVIYPFGFGVFRFLERNWQNALLLFGIILVVYFLVFALMVFDDRNTCDKINEKLKELNGGEE